MPKSSGSSRKLSQRSMSSDVGAMTLMEKRLLEKQTSKFLLDSDIRNIFQQFDRDGNGYLGAADLAKVYKAIGENLDDDLIDELIREADKDGDGQIAYPEFYALIKVLEAEGGGMRDPNAKPAPVRQVSKKGRKDESSDSDGTTESSSGSY
ncbi:hypothetical protein GUITHDRAFT_113414 [Guillardia theta CCMP2712]|uniref:EF-hand domain-containing protein n=1 Tax=Guillardia theta (strain CCMP2712) TaxID=905079 RepID=L1IWL0_GUITC|nr:hypothetical protein GUITHDRAFT_113414 [Guillardia theta CCMP2712]EKX40626.1 hypothetical protein GUITHDRAFT_113414 [Guillardia theta CCMP2712]|eukprot:XP_005827606.1 hypothetical protein GUITHDRAFT_113414 [Guillardia theta CCMP2712]